MRLVIPKPLKGLRSGLIELLSHTVMVVAILGSIKLIKVFIGYLWGHDKLLFGRFPLKYIFDGADGALILCFVTFGVYRVIVSYFKPETEGVF